ncbi:hypothetical protein GGI15_003952 [Coemansia interrupta]|uniref:Uncharacterized protein n=1 Tax=Coemansia interrupta TaxID=1126814 RepID=A0A9W8H517_9FUNG|nr:hypothetical protein GGI15_003952 [Coemansia interrupta]
MKSIYYSILLVAFTSAIVSINASPVSTSSVDTKVYRQYQRREVEDSMPDNFTAAPQEEDNHGHQYKDEYHGYLRREVEESMPDNFTAAPQEENNDGYQYKNEYHGYLRRDYTDSVPGEAHTAAAAQDDNKNVNEKVKYPGNQRLI